MAKGGGINAFTNKARKLYTAPQSCPLSNLDEASGFRCRLASWTKLQEASCLTRSRVVKKLPTEAVVTFNRKKTKEKNQKEKIMKTKQERESNQKERHKSKSFLLEALTFIRVKFNMR